MRQFENGAQVYVGLSRTCLHLNREVGASPSNVGRDVKKVPSRQRGRRICDFNVVALLNQATQSTGLGNINLTLYPLAVSHPAAFHDITTGNNIGHYRISVYTNATTITVVDARTAAALAVGVAPDRLRFRQHKSDEMAHYAADCWDAEVLLDHLHGLHA